MNANLKNLQNKKLIEIPGYNVKNKS